MFEVCRLKERFEIVMFLLIFLVAASYQNPLAYSKSKCAYLFVAPLMYVAHENGELFEVTINASLVENLHSLAFTLTYNASLLNVENVAQGSFFPPPPQSTFKFKEDESLGAVRLNISLVDSRASVNGSGTLALVSFRVIQDQESCASSPLCLEQTLLLDTSSTPLIHDVVGALFFLKSTHGDPPVEGRSLDLYTPKGGIGPNEPDGRYIFGETVTLISRVTYNSYPLQQKLVGFEVHDPSNESVIFRTVVTDQDGLAEISFRIPESPGLNGTWRAISVVEIADKAVWDTMAFWVNITLPVGGNSFATERFIADKPFTIHLLTVVILTGILTMTRRETRKKSGRHKRMYTFFALMLLLAFLRFNVLFGVSIDGDVSITDFYSCDRLGIPQDYFPRRSTAYFNISVRNLGQDPKNISIHLTVQDELEIPIGTDQLNTTIPQNASTHYIMSVFLPKWAYIGLATAYAAIWEKGNPVDSKTTQFYIGPEDLVPPVVHILSPENATYVTRPFPLVFTIDERTTWIRYSLNGLKNVTIDGNTTLAGMDKGSYRIRVYANDTSGNVGSSEEIYFTVLNLPPIASFTESATTVPTGTVINFNASSSYDPDGRIVNYFWDFGDGTSDSNVTTEHAYADNGTYTVTLTVADNDGSIATVTANKTVLNRNPVASFIESAETVPTGTVITFNASDSFDPDGSIATYAWDFGDGNFDSGVLIGHSYADNSLYNVTLTVTDNDGASSVTSALKTITDRPPVVNFSETAEAVYVDEPIHFNASTSYDPDGTIVVYFWDFGDGTNATGVTVQHSYRHKGTYTVTLTATDDDGMSASTSSIKNVLNRPDIAVSNVTSSKTVLGKGYSLQINVTIMNRGDLAETFSVTTYVNATPIATQTITLTAGSATSITFMWNSTGFVKGNYTLWAYAWPVPDETNTADNNFTDGWVLVTIAGDVTSASGPPDGRVDLRDIGLLCTKFVTTYLSPNWDPNCDINGDGVVNMRDIGIACNNFMKDP
jgi:PKD repeat protein